MTRWYVAADAAGAAGAILGVVFNAIASQPVGVAVCALIALAFVNVLLGDLASFYRRDI